MFKKLSSFCLAIVIAMLSCMTVFASQEESIGVTPRTSSIVANLNEDWHTFFTYDTLLSFSVSIYSDGSNTAPVELRTVNDDADVIDGPVVLYPGQSIDLDSGLVSYHLQGKTQGGTGQFLLIISAGTTPGIFGVNLTTDSYLTVNSGVFPFLVDKTLTITNNINSPGAFKVRITLDTGVLYGEETINPGEMADFTLTGELSIDRTGYYIEAIAVDGDGLYYISIEG